MKNLKNLMYSLIFLVLALGLVSTAYAAASFTVNDLEFGSDTQVREEVVTQTLTIHNDGTDVLTIDLTSKLPTLYQVGIVPSTVTVNPNSSSDVDVTLTIPDTASSKKIEIKSGILATATNVAGLTRTSKTFVQAESMLEITKVSIFVDDNSEKSLDENDVFDTDLDSGTPIVLRVYVRNNYDDNADLDMSDIEVSIEGSGDLELDDTESMDDLRTGDKDYVEFSADIPSDAEDGDNYDIDVTAEGRDDNGAWHYDSFSAELEVKKSANEITIKKATITPQTITCSGKVTINADIENTGRYNQNKAALGIENDYFGIDQGFYPLDMDSGDILRKSYSFNVDNKTAPGQYDIMLTTYYDSSKESNIEVVTLTVNPCEKTTTTTTTTTSGSNTNTNTQPSIPQVIPSSGATPVYGSASFTDSPTYIIILIAAVAIILLILIILLVKFVF